LLFWQTFNLVFLALGVIASLEKPEKRKAHRVPGHDAAVIFVNNETFKGDVEDISLTGIWLKIDNDLSLYLDDIRDKELKFLIKDIRGMMLTLKGKVVNANNHNIRLQFLYSNIEEEKKIVELVYAPSTRWEYIDDEKGETPVNSFLFLVHLTFKDFIEAYKIITKEFINEIYVKMLKIVQGI